MNVFILCALAFLVIATPAVARPDDVRDFVVSAAIQQSLEYSKYQQGGSTPVVNSTVLKRGSEDAIANSRRYYLFRDMVARAEAQLAEAGFAGSEEDGDSLLSSEQLARIWALCCEEVSAGPASCRGVSSQFRTIDGTCNNLKNTTFGAHATIFPRLLPALYENGVDIPRGRKQSQGRSPFGRPNPSARHVSLNIHPDNPINSRRFTNLIWQWGQFIDHDITLSPESESECMDCDLTSSCEPIKVSKSDPNFGARSKNKGNCLPFRRSLPACPINRKPVREQVNDLTSFIDGSMVYGSTAAVAKALRDSRGGLLKVGPNFPGKQSSLPFTTAETRKHVICMPPGTDCFLAGDIRVNEQTALTIMHTIWVREHNRCARNIARINMMSNDEQIYQLCRKITGAIIQKITYEEWLPKLFGRKGLRKYVGAYKRYNAKCNPGVPHAFATASFRFGHSMVPPMFGRLDRKYRPLSIGPLQLKDAFFKPSTFNKSMGTDPILRAMLTGQSRNLDRFIEKTLTTQLFKTEDNTGFDLAALNIQRGRDHGLQSYLSYARFCLRRFKAIPYMWLSDFRRLLKIYGSTSTMDLFTGGLNEIPFPGSIFGPTFACLNGIGFRNIRDGDRFFYLKKGVFTRAQLKSIRAHTLSRVLCDNMDDLPLVQRDAFLASQKRVSCKSITAFNYRPFRVDKLAEEENEVNSADNDMESVLDVSEMSKEDEWNGEEWNGDDMEIEVDEEDYDSQAIREAGGVNILEMHEQHEANARVEKCSGDKIEDGEVASISPPEDKIEDEEIESGPPRQGK